MDNHAVAFSSCARRIAAAQVNAQYPHHRDERLILVLGMPHGDLDFLLRPDIHLQVAFGPDVRMQADRSAAAVGVSARLAN